MRLNVTSEIGKLKSVLVHLPGREIDVMVPPMMTQLLFDDILYGQVAREEHRRFQQLLRFVAQNVYDIQDLLEEILEDDDVKLEVLRDLGERNKFGRKLQARLREEPAAGLAEVLIGGIPTEKDGAGELPSFDLLPVPNCFFTRDPQVVVGAGVVVCGMATQARRREALLSKYVFQHHPKFRDCKFRVDFMAGRDRKGGLADTAIADDRHQAGIGELSGQLENINVAADHAPESASSILRSSFPADVRRPRSRRSI